MFTGVLQSVELVNPRTGLQDEGNVYIRPTTYHPAELTADAQHCEGFPHRLP